MKKIFLIPISLVLAGASVYAHADGSEPAAPAPKEAKTLSESSKAQDQSAHKEVVLYVELLDKATSEADAEARFKTFRERIETARKDQNPAPIIRKVIAGNSKNLEKGLKEVLAPGEAISHLYVHADKSPTESGGERLNHTYLKVGEDEIEIASKTGDAKDARTDSRMKKVNKPANKIFSGIQKRFTKNSKVFFNSDDLLSGNPEIAKKKAEALQTILGQTSGSIYGKSESIPGTSYSDTTWMSPAKTPTPNDKTKDDNKGFTETTTSFLGTALTAGIANYRSPGLIAGLWADPVTQTAMLGYAGYHAATGTYHLLNWGYGHGRRWWDARQDRKKREHADLRQRAPETGYVFQTGEDLGVGIVNSSYTGFLDSFISDRKDKNSTETTSSEGASSENSTTSAAVPAK